jgi:hypothetical protein
MAQEIRSLAFIGFPEASLPQSTGEEGLIPRTAFATMKKPPMIRRKENGLMHPPCKIESSQGSIKNMRP